MPANRVTLFSSPSRAGLFTDEDTVDEIDQLITLKEFCLKVHITRPTAYAWNRRQFGPAMVKVGSRQFFRRSDVVSFIAGLSGGLGRPSVQRKNARRAHNR
jgi:predicted DNA-binding transcriptional regulator AlpA